MPRIGEGASTSAFVGFSPLSRTGEASGSLYEFDTAEGWRVSLHEVSCTKLEIILAEAVVAAHFNWSHEGPIHPPHAALARFAIKFDGVSEVSLKGLEIDVPPAQVNGDVEDFTWNGLSQFVLELNAIQIIVSARRATLILGNS